MSDKQGIQHEADFYQLRYSNCWEDADLLCKALENSAPGQRVLSIAAAGDNSLALLTLDPAQVVAVDLSPAQLACLDIKAAAIGALDNFSTLAFLGVKESGDRLAVYDGLRERLREESRVFWDKRRHWIAGGLLHAGRLENFYARWRRLLRVLAHSEKKTKQLFENKSLDAQRSFFQREWNTWRWRAVYRWTRGRKWMGEKGRDPAFYREAPSDVVSGPFSRLQAMLHEGRVRTNPYLRFELTGNYSSEALPLYLRPESMSVIRKRLDRLVLRRGAVEETADGPFGAMNMSNIFEYMDAGFFSEVYAKLVRQLEPGGSMAYWNLHVPRSMPPGQPMIDQSGGLTKLDLVHAYSAFRLEQKAPAAA